MNHATTGALRPDPRVSESRRWLQLAVGVVCMIATANIQYAWTLFVPEIQDTFGWSRANIQIAFTISMCFSLFCDQCVLSRATPFS